MDSRLLPEAFVTMYEALVMVALDDGLGGGAHPMSGRAAEVGRADGKAVNQWRTNSGAVTSMDRTTGPKSKQVGKTARTMKDERAWRLKVKIDKRLRGLAREIQGYLDDSCRVEELMYRVCTGRCRKFGDAEWSFCARCGGPMRELDKNDEVG